MNASYIWQCSVCGHVEVNDRPGQYEKVFRTMHCPCCDERTEHYYCGKDILDYYEFYSNILDERFYNYDKKRDLRSKK